MSLRAISAGFLLADRSTRIAVIVGLDGYPNSADLTDARAVAERQAIDAAGPNFSDRAIVALRSILAGIGDNARGKAS